jgi:hypothetical protein
MDCNANLTMGKKRKHAVQFAFGLFPANFCNINVLRQGIQHSQRRFGRIIPKSASHHCCLQLCGLLCQCLRLLPLKTCTKSSELRFKQSLLLANLDLSRLNLSPQNAAGDEFANVFMLSPQNAAGGKFANVFMRGE